MNKYFQLLEKILNEGKMQTNKKGSNLYLINETLKMNLDNLAQISSEYKVAKKLLTKELDLYMKGETQVSEYNKQGIIWWDYCKPEMVDTYPEYFKSLPKLIDKINIEKKPPRNYVLFIGANEKDKTSQQPCLSLLQMQIPNNELYMSVYARSSDASLGLPSDIFQTKLIAEKIQVPLKEITFFIGNCHIYENNIEETRKLLRGEKYKFNLNV